MGSGIAQIASQNGHHVVLVDQQRGALDRSAAQLKQVADRQVEKGRWTAEEAEGLLNRIERTDDWQLLKDCELVIEAIVEDQVIKKEVFQSIEQIVSENTLLASNTSSLSLTAIASSLRFPQRFLGLHFFNPAPLMALVEVVPALQTNHAITQAASALMKRWGKVPVFTKDTPGFIVNRLARPFYGEALRILEEGLADHHSIDRAMKDVGFRMGPFELMDLIGNDVNFAVTQTVFESFFYDPRYKPSLIQKQHVDAGWLGKKSGRGYYAYDGSGNRLEPEFQPSGSADLERIRERILAMLINEAADALYLQIASASDLELAMTKGVNYPKGLLRWANDWGVENVYLVLESLYNEYQEDRYRPSPLLKKLAREKGAFNLA